MTGKTAGLHEGVFARERQQQIACIVEETGRARVIDLAGRSRVSR